MATAAKGLHATAFITMGTSPNPSFVEVLSRGITAYSFDKYVKSGTRRWRKARRRGREGSDETCRPRIIGGLDDPGVV